MTKKKMPRDSVKTEAGKSADAASNQRINSSDQPKVRQLELWRDGSRFRNVVEFVTSRGNTGCTRDELAAEGVAPLQSVCRPVLECIRSGVFRETGSYRTTRLGAKAQVFVIVPRRTRGQK